MGKQLGLFELWGPPSNDADDRLNAAQAEMRLQQMGRAESRPRHRPVHRRKVATTCPSCGKPVTIEV